ERGTDGALLEILDGCWECATAENECEIVSAVLTKIAFDHAAVIDSSVNRRRRLDLFFQDDRQLLPNVRFRKGTEALGCFLRELKIDLPLTGTIRVIVSFLCRFQILARDDRRAVDDVPEFRRLLRTGSTAGALSWQQLCAGRKYVICCKGLRLGSVRTARM